MFLTSILFYSYTPPKYFYTFLIVAILSYTKKKYKLKINTIKYLIFNLYFYKIKKIWQQPIFSAGKPTNIVGTLELDFCVRNGNRYFLSVIITRKVLYTLIFKAHSKIHRRIICKPLLILVVKPSIY